MAATLTGACQAGSRSGTRTETRTPPPRRRRTPSPCSSERGSTPRAAASALRPTASARAATRGVGAQPQARGRPARAARPPRPPAGRAAAPRRAPPTPDRAHRRAVAGGKPWRDSSPVSLSAGGRRLNTGRATAAQTTTLERVTELLLNVLDQSPISEGSTGADALRNTLDLARLADGLGYHRYWVAEHHGTPMLACASPEVLIGPIAAGTERIRVGSGGVMLPHYSPLKVAETLQHPERALSRTASTSGIGRAPGTDQLTLIALQRDRRQAAAGRLPAAARRAARLPRGRDAAGPPVRAARGAARACRSGPRPWLLGSSPQSGDLGGASSGCPTASPTSSTRTARRSRRATARRFAPSGALPSAAGGRGRDGRCARRRTRRPSGSPPAAGWRCAAARGTARAGAAGREGAALPRDAEPARPAGSGRRAVIGSPETRARRGSRRWQRSTAPMS